MGGENSCPLSLFQIYLASHFCVEVAAGEKWKMENEILKIYEYVVERYDNSAGKFLLFEILNFRNAIGIGNIFIVFLHIPHEIFILTVIFHE